MHFLYFWGKYIKARQNARVETMRIRIVGENKEKEDEKLRGSLIICRRRLLDRHGTDQCIIQLRSHVDRSARVGEGSFWQRRRKSTLPSCSHLRIARFPQKRLSSFQASGRPRFAACKHKPERLLWTLPSPSTYVTFARDGHLVPACSAAPLRRG